MQIGKISLHRAEASKNGVLQNNATQMLNTNPFGVSFKGNVIQADVFQSRAKKTSAGIREKSKLFASAVVSGINNFNEAFKSRINSVVSFGKKITTNVINSIDKLGKKEIKFDMEGIKNRIFPDREYEVKNLKKKPVDDLREMWSGLTPKQA